MNRILLPTVVTSTLLGLQAYAQPLIYNWLTIAGNAGNSDDGTNGAAHFESPWGIAVDIRTNIYVVDQGNLTIRKVMPVGTNWVSSTIAGLTGVPGSTDGTNTDARFGRIPGENWGGPQGIAVDTSGNVYVADSCNSIIRKITPMGTNWVTTTIAGLAGSYGNVDGTNSAARFGYPAAIAADGAGNLYVADPGDGINTIRKITSIGTNWVTTTIGGQVGVVGFSDGLTGSSTFGFPCGIAVDKHGNVFVADTGDSIVRELTQVGANWLTTTIAGIQNPFGIAVDGSGNVYVSDPFHSTIRKLTPVGTSWVSSTFSSGFLFTTHAIAADDAGNVYLTNGGVIELSFQGTNSVSRFLAGGGYPGNIGSRDGEGSAARFYAPQGITADCRGNVFIADTGNNTIRKLTRAGASWVSSTIAGSAANIGSADGANNSVEFGYPWGIAVDSSGSLYVADTYNGTIRTLKPEGTNWVSRTIGGLAGNFGSIDGTNSDMQFDYPKGIATYDGATVYVADTLNSTIRKLTQNGSNWVSSTVSGLPEMTGSEDGTNSEARFDRPEGIALDGNGNLYVTDSGNFTIRRLTPMGTNWIVTTIAGLVGHPGSLDGTNSDARFGGPIAHAQVPEFAGPQGITADSSGSLYVGDPRNCAIRKVTLVGTNWVTTTIGGPAGGSVDGLGSKAQFSVPGGVTVDGFGNVYVADTLNNTIRQGVPLAVLQVVPQSGGGAILTWSADVGRVFQLQYISDLTSTNWINAGSTFTATNQVVSTSISLRSYRQGFYRVLMLQ